MFKFTLSVALLLGTLLSSGSAAPTGGETGPANQVRAFAAHAYAIGPFPTRNAAVVYARTLPGYTDIYHAVDGTWWIMR